MVVRLFVSEKNGWKKETDRFIEDFEIARDKTRT